MPAALLAQAQEGTVAPLATPEERALEAGVCVGERQTPLQCAPTVTKRTPLLKCLHVCVKLQTCCIAVVVDGTS